MLFETLGSKCKNRKIDLCDVITVTHYFNVVQLMFQDCIVTFFLSICFRLF